jgi:hypothetical protein
MWTKGELTLTINFSVAGLPEGATAGQLRKALAGRLDDCDEGRYPLLVEVFKDTVARLVKDAACKVICERM